MSHDNKKFEIKKDVLEFAKVTFKKYKHKISDESSYNDYADEKDLKRGYRDYLLDRLPATIDFLVRYGHINQEQINETKAKIYNKINTEEFVKMVKKAVKNEDEIKHLELLPIAISECLEEANRINKEMLANDPNAKIIDMSVLTGLSEFILGKKLDKLVKKTGCTKALAFDLLSIIPCKEALQIGRNYRFHAMFECMYQHKKNNEEIKVDEIIPRIIKEEMIPLVVVFALLERKEKYAKLTDEQKILYVDITNWCFKVLESMNSDVLRRSLEYYANNRKKDDEQGKDGNRRYSLKTLPQDDYQRIVKTINKIINNNPGLEKYFK